MSVLIPVLGTAYMRNHMENHFYFSTWVIDETRSAWIVMKVVETQRRSYESIEFTA